ncbi:MAG: hypothetical protein ACRERD_33195 [Candidatus Binatia bacterium]
MTRRLRRLEQFYEARAMPLSDMLSLVDRVVYACSLHLDPATLARLTTEIEEIVALATEGNWEAIAKHIPSGVWRNQRWQQ